MSFENIRTVTMTPITANVVNQLRFVSMVASTATIDETTAGKDAIGVSLESSPAANSVVIPVALLDGAIMEVEAGATVAVGAPIASDATGRAITATGAVVQLGTALSGGSVGQLITIIGSRKAADFA